jgi:hypothetical protein
MAQTHTEKHRNRPHSFHSLFLLVVTEWSKTHNKTCTAVCPGLGHCQVFFRHDDEVWHLLEKQFGERKSAASTIWTSLATERKKKKSDAMFSGIDRSALIDVAYDHVGESHAYTHAHKHAHKHAYMHTRHTHSRASNAWQHPALRTAEEGYSPKLILTFVEK